MNIFLLAQCGYFRAGIDEFCYDCPYYLDECDGPGPDAYKDDEKEMEELWIE